jgi:hypothetical protein
MLGNFPKSIMLVHDNRDIYIVKQLLDLMIWI